MEPLRKLEPVHLKAISLYLRGESKSEIARAFGKSYRWVACWFASPAFKQALEKAKSELSKRFRSEEEVEIRRGLEWARQGMKAVEERGYRGESGVKLCRTHQEYIKLLLLIRRAEPREKSSEEKVEMKKVQLYADRLLALHKKGKIDIAKEALEAVREDTRF